MGKKIEKIWWWNEVRILGSSVWFTCLHFFRFNFHPSTSHFHLFFIENNRWHLRSALFKCHFSANLTRQQWKCPKNVKESCEAIDPSMSSVESKKFCGFYDKLNGIERLIIARVAQIWFQVVSNLTQKYKAQTKHRFCRPRSFRAISGRP